MRVLLRTNAEWHGRCVYHGYIWRPHHLEALLRNGSHVCGEAHTSIGSFWDDVERLRSLSIVTAGACSGVKVIVRVREPFSWYVSFFLWPSGFHGLQRLNETSLPCNLQARLLLGEKNYWRRSCLRLSASEQQRVARAVALADVVAPLDRFDEAIVLAARLTGGWLGSTYSRSNEHRTSADPARLKNASELCGESDPALPRCRALVRRLAPDDHALYARAVAAFETQLAAHRGAEWDEELRQHLQNVAALTSRSTAVNSWRSRQPGERPSKPPCTKGLLPNANPGVNRNIQQQLATCTPAAAAAAAGPLRGATVT